MDCHPSASHWLRPPVRLCAVVALLALGCLTPTAHAQSPELFADVQDQLTQMQQQIDALQAEAALQAAAASSPRPPEIIYCPSTPKPKFPTVRLTGFLQADAVWTDQDAANRAAIVDGNPIGDIQDGMDFRRARLAAKGKAWDNVGYMLEMDFAFPGRPSFMDVWLEIEQVLGDNRLRIGLSRQPFGMDGLTSARELTFLERGLPFAFIPLRQIGAVLHGHSEDEVATWSLGGFRFPTGPYGGNVGDNGGYGMATRLTGLLVNREDHGGLLHIGGAYCFIDPANDQLRYSNQPESFVSQAGGNVPSGVPSVLPVFVDTGVIAAEHVNLFAAELAMSYGSFYAQSEAIYAAVKQTAGPSLTLPSAYVQGGYFLTGESRVYNGDSGVFGRVKPHRNVGKDGGIGAWEIAARWSYLDLNDANIRGGRLNDLTAGLNWYLNPYTKFQWNYIYAMLDNPTNGDSEAGFVAMRGQVDF
ncbi:OprO/OprP family phosphate-selective porin [Roseimaritima ulvae]|uniref:Porin P n=1 Tax=Roseimaritima ulvae TaxID=980254 RepID=A0A5B9R2E9_9BACT|nr:porin [Roseimaritima ulvae]QEG43576.1 Porin P precursor [Roseimaritima ulvae]